MVYSGITIIISYQYSHFRVKKYSLNDLILISEKCYDCCILNKGILMLKDLGYLKAQGCSSQFIEIVKKYNRSNTSLIDMEKFIEELEEYKAEEMLPAFEDQLIDTAKKMFASMHSSPVIRDDDSTESAIRRNEMDYNGDVFTSMGL